MTKRSRPKGNVYTALIEPEWLLAYINEGHSEQEWVIDPGHLGADDVQLHADEDPR